MVIGLKPFGLVGGGDGACELYRIWWCLAAAVAGTACFPNGRARKERDLRRAGRATMLAMASGKAVQDTAGPRRSSRRAPLMC